MDELKEVREQLKRVPPEQMAANGFIRELRPGEYICPYCGNGQGESKTGIKPSLLAAGYSYHCFKCNARFDNVDLVALHNNLDPSNGKEFVEVLKRANAAFNLANVDTSVKPEPKKSKDFSNFYKFATQQLEKFIANEGGSYRNLPLTVYKKFNCGYVPSHGQEKLPRLIIPTSEKHFLARLPFDKHKLEDSRGKDFVNSIAEKKHSGKKEIFNLRALLTEQPIFLVEGEFDCMTVDYLGYPCIAISGSSLSRDMRQQLRETPKRKFIVMLDNDDTGRQHAPQVADELNHDGHFAVVQPFDLWNLFEAKDEVKRQIVDRITDMNDLLKYEVEHRLEGLSKKYLERVYAACRAKLDKAAADFAENPIDFNAPEPPPEPVAFTPKPITPDLTTKSQLPSCPIDLNIPKGFSFAKNGIYVQTSKGDHLVTRTPIIPSREFRTNNGNDLLELSYQDARTHAWHKCIVPKTLIASATQILALAGYGVSITQTRAKHLCDFLTDILTCADNNSKIPSSICYQQPGWHDHQFIYPDPNSDEVIVNNLNFDYKATFTVKGEKSAWQEKFVALVRSSWVARFCIGAALATPLLKIFKVRNIQVNLGTQSGSGKTALCKFVTSIFCDPDKAVIDFNGTANFLDDYAYYFNDFPHAINEIQTLRRKFKEEELVTSVYKFESGSGRNRLKRTGVMQEQRHFRGTRFTTGEEPLLRDNVEQGAIARVIEIGDKRIMEDALAKSLHRMFTSGNHGHFGREWIRYILQKKKDLKDSFERLEKEFTQMYPKNLSSHITTSAAAFTALLAFTKMLDAELAAEVTQKMTADLGKVMNSQPDTDHATTIERAIQALSDYINSHEKMFKRQKKTEDRDKEQLATFDQVETLYAVGVFLSDGRVGFYPHLLKKIMQDELGFSSYMMLLKEFGERGWLDSGRDGRNNYSRPIRYYDAANDKSKVARLIVFTKDALNQIDDAETVENLNDGKFIKGDE